MTRSIRRPCVGRLTVLVVVAGVFRVPMAVVEIVKVVTVPHALVAAVWPVHVLVVAVV